MKEESQKSAARLQVLETAERMFTERGYALVSLNDIAQALNIRTPSLYYHAPGGKEELFVLVMLRNLERHHEAILQILHEPGLDLETRLVRLLKISLDCPPLHWWRMITSDMPSLSPENAQKLQSAVERMVFDPLREMFIADSRTISFRYQNFHFLTGMFLTLGESLQYAQHFDPEHLEELTIETARLMLYGILPKNTG